MKTYCKYGNHYYDTAEIGTGCYYTDLDNGIPNDTPTCPDCYNSHILKHYPNGRMAEHIRQNAEYRPKSETKEG